MKAARRQRQEGFAMAVLIFFLTAASILMAAAVPSYLMEAQRQQEQELIFRGQEYVRAIQKFQRKFHVYPPTIDALLNTNDIRFLRKAYTDPMTGKPMRLIFLNPDGSISGSVLYSTGASLTNPSLGGAMGSTGITGATLNSSGLHSAAGVNGAASATGTTGSTSLNTASGATGSTGFSLGSLSAGGASGANGLPGSGSPTAFGSPTGGTTSASGTAGIVGVASNSDLKSIMVYNNRQKYKEWEFIALQQQTPTTGVNTPGNMPGAAGGAQTPFVLGNTTGGANGTTTPTTTTPTTTKPPGF
jgi:type II secretory pathway pseudopilin PulG